MKRTFHNIWRLLPKTTTDQHTALWGPVATDTSTPQVLDLRLGYHCRKRDRKIIRARGIRSYTHEVSPIRQNEDGTNRNVNIEGSHEVPSKDRTTGNSEMLRMEKVSSPKKAPIVYPIPNAQA